MPATGFEPAIPASERPQTHALDRAATGIGLDKSDFGKMLKFTWSQYFKHISPAYEFPLLAVYFLNLQLT